MRYWIIVVVVGFGGVAALTFGQPGETKSSGKQEVIPELQKGRKREVVPELQKGKKQETIPALKKGKKRETIPDHPGAGKRVAIPAPPNAGKRAVIPGFLPKQAAIPLLPQQKVAIPQLRIAPPADPIRVVFRGPVVRVEAKLDISNVVLEYSDGARQKFDDLDGHVMELRGTGPHAGKEVFRAWVKSGPNFSGDGPGYGQRFERPR
jgi:hypothetical protein